MQKFLNFFPYPSSAQLYLLNPNLENYKSALAYYYYCITFCLYKILMDLLFKIKQIPPHLSSLLTEVESLIYAIHQ